MVAVLLFELLSGKDLKGPLKPKPESSSVLGPARRLDTRSYTVIR